jgi:cytochrome c peroxidase
VQPAFFHNGSFTRLEDAIAHHLDPFESARSYNASSAGVARDLSYRLGPIEPVLSRIDPRIAHPATLHRDEFENLVAFVRKGLLDSRAEKQHTCSLVPFVLPSGARPIRFDGCPPAPN